MMRILTCVNVRARNVLVAAVLVVGTVVLVRKSAHLTRHSHALQSGAYPPPHTAHSVILVQSPGTGRVSRANDVNSTRAENNVSSKAGDPGQRARKKIVYSCQRGGCGGWADRQKGIVSAYVLAEMLDRDFGVSVTFPCDLDRFMTPTKLDWKVKVSDLRLPDVKIHATVDSGAVHFAKHLVGSKDLEQELPGNTTVLTWNMEVVQYLRQHSLASHVAWMAGKTVPEIYRQAWKDLFTLTPDLRHELDKLQQARPAGTQLVCAQVRLGKHEGTFPDVESWHTFDQFPILVDFLTKYNDSSKYRILVTSDSTKIIEMAGRKFPGIFLTIPGEITHTDKSTGSNACDGFKKTILDEYALSMCDVLVISESGIGKIASFMRGTDEKLYLFHDVKIEPFTREGRFPNKLGW